MKERKEHKEEHRRNKGLGGKAALLQGPLPMQVLSTESQRQQWGPVVMLIVLYCFEADN